MQGNGYVIPSGSDRLAEPADILTRQEAAFDSAGGSTKRWGSDACHDLLRGAPNMSEAERTRLLDVAFDSSPEALANFLAVLDARLQVFEQRYELPASGELRETGEVSEWLFVGAAAEPSWPGCSFIT